MTKHTAKQKTNLEETPEQTSIREYFEVISNKASRSEKISWDRKMDNMVQLIAKLKPIEEQVLELLALKQPVMDQIADLRKEMVSDCVHPITHLAYKDEFAECKFCNRKFAVVS
jgi:hypothetical protein